MSYQSQGEGWWQASDGKWYPPPRPDAPATPTMPTTPTTQPFGDPTGMPGAAATYGPPTGPPIGAADTGKKRGLGAGTIIGIAVVVAVIVGAIAFLVTRDDGKSVPSGFKAISDQASGVSIGVPRNFSENDPSRLVNSDAQSDFGSENSDLAPILSSGNAILHNSVLAASGSVDGTPAIVVVAKDLQRIDPSDMASTGELESQLSDELESIGGSDISIDKVTLPAGQALRVRVTLEINTASTPGTVHETIYFVTAGRTTWAILGVTVGGTTASDLFDQIAKTFSVSS